MTVMVVVIICLLNHYKLSTWSFITRQSQARRHDHALQQVGVGVGVWVGGWETEKESAKKSVCLCWLYLVAQAALFSQHPCQ